MFTQKSVYLYILFVLLGAMAVAQEFQLQTTLSGHQGKVQNIRFSPDGKLLASGGHDGLVILWEVATGKVVRTLKGHTQAVYEVTFNKDGKLLASAGEDGMAKVWEVSSGKNIATFYNKPYLFPNGTSYISTSFVVFTPDNRSILFSGDNGYIMKGTFRPQNGGAPGPAELLFSTNYADGRWYSTVTGGTISADEKYLIVTVGQLVEFIDFNTGEMVKYFRYDDDYLNDVVNGPLPNTIATWSYDGKVSFWNTQSGKITSKYQVTERENYSATSFSKDSRYMVTGASGTVAKVWDLSNGRQLATLSGHSQIIRISRFSPVENVIATGSYDGTIKIWKEKIPDPEPVVVAKKEPEPPVVTPRPRPQPRPEPQPTKKDEPEKADNKITYNNESVEVGKSINLENILFEQSSYMLTRASYAEMDKLLAFMKQYPTLEIELEGHTDNVGDPQKNQTLSERRVLAVKNYLTQRGIEERRINTSAYGGSRPIASNATEAGRRKNRRVEMKILKV